MRSSIPIRNIYYLLSYAWDSSALLGNRRLAAENSPSVIDLLARLFAGGVAALRRPGLDRSYREMHSELALIRGKPDFAESNKRLSRLRARIVCRYEELDPDILHNRILKSTLERLLVCKGLSAESRRSLHLPREILQQISPVALDLNVFHRVQLHRNNRHYRLLLNVCELLWKQMIPSEASGQFVFRDFIESEAVMSTIFEKFVFNFSVRHFPEAKTTAEWISWDGEAMDEPSRALLPSMKTDLSVDWPSRKLILDCKFYKAALSGRWSEKLEAENLYQIFAYLKNKSVTPGWSGCNGVLLYPTVDRAFDCRYKLSGHVVRVVTLDLNRPWQVIEQDLLSILSGQPTHSNEGVGVSP